MPPGLFSHLKEQMTKPKHPRTHGVLPQPRRAVKPRILEMMVPRQSYTSAGIAHALGMTRMVVLQALLRMGGAGEIGILPVGRDNLYFASQADADAFGAAEKDAFAADQLSLRRASVSRLTAAAANRVKPEKPGLPPAVTIPAKCTAAWSARPADSTGARVIVCKSPSFDARYQVDPEERIVGGFATMGVGQYIA